MYRTYYIVVYTRVRQIFKDQINSLYLLTDKLFGQVITNLLYIQQFKLFYVFKNNYQISLTPNINVLVMKIRSNSL